MMLGLKNLPGGGICCPNSANALHRCPHHAASTPLWGVWHSPFIAMGYNYGSEHPAAGILAMIVFCTALGCVQGWIFFRVRSVWPAALLHAAINGLDLCAPSELFMSRPANMFVGPDLIGLIGGAGILAAATVCTVSLARRQPVRNT